MSRWVCGTTPVEGSRYAQRAKRELRSSPTIPSVEPVGSSGAGTALQGCPKLGCNSRPLYFYNDHFWSLEMNWLGKG